jgi:predicted O-methyltransferase YrrM
MMLLRRRRSLTADERFYIDRIESERLTLERSDDEVELIDYGARAADQKLTSEDMSAGVRTRRVIGDVCRVSSKPPKASRLLFDVLRERRPRACLELGTCLGISAAYQAAALELNGDGFLHTIEGAEPLAVRAGNLFSRLGLAHRVDLHVGRFKDVLPDLLQENIFDYAFVDGHHDEHATIEYFGLIHPRVRSGGVMVFDDIRWSVGMQRAWEAIRASEAAASSSERDGLGFAAIV